MKGIFSYIKRDLSAFLALFLIVAAGTAAFVAPRLWADSVRQAGTDFFAARSVADAEASSSLHFKQEDVESIRRFPGVGAAEGFSVDDAEKAMKDVLNRRFNDDEDAYTISSQNLIEEAMNSITNVLTILLGGIAAISLIVGGIGIMNIMLVTVTERTREIGIRKAIGASRSTILRQFLIEAVVLCMFGCALGIFISWAILQIISIITANTALVFHLQGRVVGLSVLFCLIIGVVFGLYPANKAAKMKPIDALHHGG